MKSYIKSPARKAAMGKVIGRAVAKTPVMKRTVGKVARAMPVAKMVSPRMVTKRNMAMKTGRKR